MLPLTRSRHRARFFGNAPTLAFDFISASALDSRITFTRASGATRFNSSGVLETVSNDVPRLDYNPATLAAQGLLIEEQRTNSIRNNTMQGAVAGTPGTAPTNWTITTGGGVTRTIVGVGMENGIAYVDVRLQAASAVNAFVLFDTNNQIAASNGQTWTASTYVKLISGATTNLDISSRVTMYSSAPALLGNFAVTVVPTTANLANQSYRNTATLNNASVATIDSELWLIASGAYDITLRIGLPQLEQGAFATSVIPTTTAAVTRAADVASVNTLTPWFNAAQGTIYVEASNAQVNASLFSTDDGTSLNRIITYFNVANSPAFRVVSGGADQCNYSAGTITQNAVFKLAAAYRTNDFAASLNGAAVVTDTSGTIPTGQTTARIGTNVSSANSINGYIRRIVYYPRGFAGAQLQALTA